MSVDCQHKYRNVNRDKEELLAVLDQEGSYIPSSVWAYR